jgi:hypothetical protein
MAIRSIELLKSSSLHNQHRRSLLHKQPTQEVFAPQPTKVRLIRLMESAVSIHVCVCFFCLKEQADFVINNLGIQLKEDLKNSMCKWRPLLLFATKGPIGEPN